MRVRVGLLPMYLLVLGLGTATVSAQETKALPSKVHRLLPETDVWARTTLARKAAGADDAVPATDDCGQLGPFNLISPFKIALRLGAMVSPRTGLAVGVDASVPGLHLLPQFSTRVDADYILVSKPNAGTFDFVSFIPVTIDQVYSKSILAGSRVYFGAGIGPYFAKTTRFGGKVFVGAGLGATFGLEATLHFAGVGDPLVTVQIRFGL
jgi:hypothetical protein